MQAFISRHKGSRQSQWIEWRVVAQDPTDSTSWKVVERFGCRTWNPNEGRTRAQQWAARNGFQVVTRKQFIENTA